MRLVGRTPVGQTLTGRRATIWTQIRIGCVVAFLLVAGAVAAGIHAVHRRGTVVLSRAWKDLRTTTERLQTMESAQALYRSNPALGEIYPTEEEFLRTVEAWRPRLGEVPANPPSVGALFREKQMIQVHRNRSDGHETVQLKFTFASGAVLEMETDQGRLTNLLLR